MPLPILNINPEKKILKKIRIAVHAYSITPYDSVREATDKEQEKELEKISNPEYCLFF